MDERNNKNLKVFNKEKSDKIMLNFAQKLIHSKKFKQEEKLINNDITEMMKNP
jgi:hypothetical protein